MAVLPPSLPAVDSPRLTEPAPRLVAAERLAVAVVVALVVGAVAVRPLAERGDPQLAAELRAQYDGPRSMRASALQIIPGASTFRSATGAMFSVGIVTLPPSDDPWGMSWRIDEHLGEPIERLPGCVFRGHEHHCHSSGPDRQWATEDDLDVELWEPRSPSHEAIVCARPALLALALGVALLALVARALPRPATTGQDVGIALALAGAAIGALVPFTSGWVDALPREVKDAISARLLVDARHAIVGSVVVVTVVCVLLLRLGRRHVDPPIEDEVAEPVAAEDVPEPKTGD